jgi:murein DD-endopeptidase MepM/ murein hydrolase activator NlpD
MPASIPIIDCPVPLLRFVSPFPKIGNDGSVGEFTSPGELVRAWGRTAEDGFYPLGLSGQWHGGIHFDGGTAAQLYQADGVRCIADGEVVAWRYDNMLSTTEYPHKRPTNPPDKDGKMVDASKELRKGFYSTNFVLVRHRLRIPVKPIGPVPAGITANTPAEEPYVPYFQFAATPSEASRMGEPAPQPSVVLYSLYMNLRNPQAYTDDPDLPRPEFWGGNKRKVGRKCQVPRPAGAPASVVGALGQNLMKNDRTAVAWVPQGTVLELQNGSGRKRRLQSIENVATHLVRIGADTTAVTNLWVYDEVLDVLAGLPTITTAATTTTPAIMMNVLDNPVPIAAGDLIGHLGIYERFEDIVCYIRERQQVHVELFAASGELENFITECRNANRKQVLPESTLLVRQGVNTYQESPASSQLAANTVLRRVHNTHIAGTNWVKVERGTLSASNIFTPSGTPTVWIRSSDCKKTYVFTVPAGGIDSWNAFPLQATTPNEIQPTAADKTFPIKGIPFAMDDQSPPNRWWYVDTDYVTPSGTQPQTGWVRDTNNDREVKSCSLWEWPGFEIINDATPPVEHQVMREDAGYNPNTTPMLRTLFETIDLDRNGRLQIQEIHAAWENATLVESLSKKIIRHKSEWKLDMDQWNALDDHFKNLKFSYFDFEEIWKQEKKRIEKHAFWDDIYNKQPAASATNHPISGASVIRKNASNDPNDGPRGQWLRLWPRFPQAAVADHVHPLAVIENFGKLWHPDVRWPLVVNLIARLNASPINNTYGRVRWPISGPSVPKAHQGWDLYAEEGTDCYAIADGEIVKYTVSTAGYGKQLILKLDDSINLPNFPNVTLYAFYAHLSSVSSSITSQQTTTTPISSTNAVRVSKGDVIGQTGKSGNANDLESFQQHLHFEIRGTGEGLSEGFGGRINPAELYHAPPLGCPVIDPI